MSHQNAIELAADGVIAGSLRSTLLYERGRYVHDLRSHAMPTEAHRAVWSAICTLRDQKQDLMDTAILKITGDAVKPEWLFQRMAEYSGIIDRQFDHDAKLLVEHGRTELLKAQLANALKALSNGGKIDDMRLHLMDVLSQERETGIKDVTASDLASMLRSDMDTQPQSLISTGLAWLDGLAGGGFELGHLWWVSGKYKGRKTSTMLNVVLGVLLSNDQTSVCFLSREMHRKRVTGQLVAMLAVTYLLENKLYNALDQRHYPLNMISAQMLNQHKSNYKKWDPRKVEAIDYGIEKFRSFQDRLRIYDTTEAGGELSDIGSVQRVFARDIALYDGQIYFADYLQLFDAPGKSLFEQVSFLSKAFQKMAQKKEKTLVLAAQLNEETVKGNRSYSPGVKGGGDAAATADYLVRTSYKDTPEAKADQLTLNMKLSRYGAAGDDITHVFDVHAPSGLLLDSTWIKR